MQYYNQYKDLSIELKVNNKNKKMPVLNGTGKQPCVRAYLATRFPYKPTWLKALLTVMR